jgi:hypothetical protein
LRTAFCGGVRWLRRAFCGGVRWLRRAFCARLETTTGRHHAHPHALVLVLQGYARTVRGHHGHGACERLVDPEGHLVTVRVRTEDGVRLAVLTSGELIDLGDRDLPHRSGPSVVPVFAG